MADENDVIDDQIADEQAASEPEIDLSAVPEKVRAHVDKDKYLKDEDYKRAVTHGWKPKDVYLEDGGDEANWTGYKVFNRRYEDMQDRKDSKRTMEEMKRSQDALLRTIEEEKVAAVERYRKDQEARLQAAIADGDAQQAVAIQREIAEIRQPERLVQQPVLEPLPIRDVRRKNAFVNPDSPEFDKAISDEFIAIARQKAESYYNQLGRKLSDYEMKVIADEAIDMVRDKAKKPAQQQAAPLKAPASAKPAATGKADADPLKKLNGVQREFYNKIAEVNGKEAAERYLKNLSVRA